MNNNKRRVKAAGLIVRNTFSIAVPARIVSTPTPIHTVPGETIQITVDIEGVPTPTPTWSVESRQLITDEHHILEQTPTSVSLTIPSADVSDTATITLTVKNETGEDSVSVEVTVTGGLCFF